MIYSRFARVLLSKSLATCSHSRVYVKANIFTPEPDTDLDEYIGPPAERSRQFAVKTIPADKDVGQLLLEEEEELLRLHREEVEAAINSLHIREEGRSTGNDRQPDVRVWDPSELAEAVPKKRGSSDFSKRKFNPEIPKKNADEALRRSLKEQGPIVGEMRTKSGGTTIQDVQEEDLLEDGVMAHGTMVAEKEEVTEPSTTVPSTTTTSTTTEAPIITTTMEESGEPFEDEDHFEQFGTRPRVVQPKLNSNDIDEDVVPEVVVPVPTVPPPPPTEPPTLPTTKLSTTTEPARTLATATVTIPLPTIEELELAEAQMDIIDERTLMEPNNEVTYKVNKGITGVSKVIPGDSLTKKKTKSFGFTGFVVRKASKKHVHDGDVTAKTAPMNIRSTTPATTKTTTRVREKIIEEDISADTLHALDWMLQNITKIAEQGDEAFLKALKQSANEQPEHTQVHENEAIGIARQLPVVSSDATKRKNVGKKMRKTKKFKKGRKYGFSKKRIEKKLAPGIVKVHSGEMKPVHVDKKKMFPKFKTRVNEANRARSFGVRTVSEDKDDTDWKEQNSETLESRSHKDLEGRETSSPNEDSAHLMEEIEELQGLVNNMEKQAFEADGKNGNAVRKGPEPVTSYPIKPDDPAMELSLVPTTSGFSPASNQDFYQQPMHMIADGTKIDDTHWTEWSPWAECFCEKQVRTRRCMYTGAMSSGCEGSSFESRSCTGGWCPVSPEIVRPELTTTRPEETFANPKDPRRPFRPLYIRTATSLS